MSGAAASADFDFAGLLAQIPDLQTRLAKIESERDEYRKLYLLMREENEKLRRGLIGQKSHQIPAGDDQLSLAVLGLLLGEQAAAGDVPKHVVPEHERRTPVRKPFPEHLPRVVIELVPPEVEREGLDAFEMIGAERREVIERRPRSVRIFGRPKTPATTRSCLRR